MKLHKNLLAAILSGLLVFAGVACADDAGTDLDDPVIDTDLEGTDLDADAGTDTETP